MTGAGFITLAATLAIVPDIPIASLAILVGIMAFAGIHIGIFSVLAAILMAIAARPRHA